MFRETEHRPEIKPEIADPFNETEEDDSIKGRRILNGGKLSHFGNVYGLGSKFEGLTSVDLAADIIGIVQEVDGEPKITRVFQIPQGIPDEKRYIRIEDSAMIDLDGKIPPNLQSILPIIDDYNRRLKKNLVIELGPRLKSVEDRKEKFSQRLKEYLEKEGIIQYGPKDEIICDLERIAALDRSLVDREVDNTTQIKRQNKQKSKVNINWQAELLNLFKDKSVYSQTDWQKKDQGDQAVKPKPLFYMPSKDKAFDINAIQQSDFYLSISDINGNWKNINQYFRENLGYSAEEAELALRIYHPKFGSGYRDKSGRLIVRELFDSAKFVTINSEWISNKKIARSGKKVGVGIKAWSTGKTKTGNQVPLWSSPKTAILNTKYDNLRQSGILGIDDFSQNEGSNASFLHRDERLITDKVGTLNITTEWEDQNGMQRSLSPRYVFGSQFRGKLSVKLADGLYGIVDEVQGVKRVTHVFRPASPEMIQEKIAEFEVNRGRKPKSAEIFFAKRDKDSPKPIAFSSTELSPRRENESAEEYAERVATFNAVREYNKLQQISKDLSEQASAGIHNLSLQEQNALTTYAFKSDKNYQGVIDFAKRFGNEGLKTFLACEYDMAAGDQISKISEKVSQPTAEKIFDKYSEIINVADSLMQQLQEKFSQSHNWSTDIQKRIRENLLKKGKDLLFHFAALTDKDKDEQAILSQLEKTKNEIILLASVFKSLARENPITPEELEGFALEIKQADRLNNEQRQQMTEIFAANRPTYPAELLKASAKTFQAALVSPQATFHIISHGQDIVAFIRFEDLPNGHRYAGSLNVRSEAKDLAVGGALLAETLDREAAGRIIEADAYALIPMLKNYVEKFGFTITGFDPSYHDSGEPFYKLTRNDQLRNELSGPKLNKEKIAGLENQPTIQNSAVLRLKPGLPAQEHESLLQPYFEKNYIVSRYLQEKSGEVLIYLEPQPAESKKIFLAA
jgi:hypothetical protein